MIDFFMRLTWGDYFLGFVAYFCIWWISLFLTLPLYITRQKESDLTKGVEKAAPAQHYIKQKMLLTTLIAFIIWIALHYFLLRDGFSFREWVLAF